MAFSKDGEFLNPGVKSYFASNGELRYPALDNLISLAFPVLDW